MNSRPEITVGQLERLLRVADTRKNRNWTWLSQWLDGAYGEHAAEYVVRTFEDDSRWKKFPPHGE